MTSLVRSITLAAGLFALTGIRTASAQLTVFAPSEVELGETTEAMIAAIDEIRPQRVVLDSLSELRLIAQNALRYRRQVLALKQFLAGRECTVLLLDDQTGGVEDDHLQSIAHGVVVLEQLANQFGAERRRLRVSKMRGVAFRGGYHDFTIKTGGVAVFPRLVAADHRLGFTRNQMTTGIVELDKLLGGGIEQGSRTRSVANAPMHSASRLKSLTRSSSLKSLSTSLTQKSAISCT